MNRENIEYNAVNMKVSQTKKSKEYDSQRTEFSQKDIEIMKLKE